MNRTLPLLTSCVATALLAATATAADSAAPAPRSPVGFIKGYTWGWVGTRGSWQGQAAADSMKALAETGTTWACLAFTARMPTKSTPEILWGDANPRMVADDEIRQAVKMARANRLKVILKPVVDPADGAWRGTIGFKTADGKDDLATWQKWWQVYEAFLLHYAAVAQAEKCEVLCIGCEMASTERFEKEWRALIAKIRKAYSGPLVYNCNHGSEDKVAWWDAVDIIGISGYYPVSTKDDTSLDKMTASWEKVRGRLRTLSAKFNRPVMFAEIGVRSAKSCTTMPWDWTHPDLPYDADEQARFYESALKTFWGEPWFCGFAWWDWPARLYAREQGGTNRGFCCYGKPAEAIMRAWYAKPR
jgi:hypothetical protein